MVEKNREKLLKIDLFFDTIYKVCRVEHNMVFDGSFSPVLHQKSCNTAVLLQFLASHKQKSACQKLSHTENA